MENEKKSILSSLVGQRAAASADKHVVDFGSKSFTFNKETLVDYKIEDGVLVPVEVVETKLVHRTLGDEINYKHLFEQMEREGHEMITLSIPQSICYKKQVKLENGREVDRYFVTLSINGNKVELHAGHTPYKIPKPFYDLLLKRMEYFDAVEANIQEHQVD